MRWALEMVGDSFRCSPLKLILWRNAGLVEKKVTPTTAERLYEEILARLRWNSSCLLYDVTRFPENGVSEGKRNKQLKVLDRNKAYDLRLPNVQTNELQVLLDKQAMNNDL